MPPPDLRLEEVKPAVRYSCRDPSFNDDALGLTVVERTSRDHSLVILEEMLEQVPQTGVLVAITH